jgi:hypothetical protein
MRSGPGQLPVPIGASVTGSMTVGTRPTNLFKPPFMKVGAVNPIPNKFEPVPSFTCVDNVAPIDSNTASYTWEVPFPSGALNYPCTPNGTVTIVLQSSSFRSCDNATASATGYPANATLTGDTLVITFESPDAPPAASVLVDMDCPVEVRGVLCRRAWLRATGPGCMSGAGWRQADTCHFHAAAQGTHTLLTGWPRPLSARSLACMRAHAWCVVHTTVLPCTSPLARS